ncbi:MAG: hypothetical protein RR280_04430 [Bacteroidaceae bacterium]
MAIKIVKRSVAQPENTEAENTEKPLQSIAKTAPKKLGPFENKRELLEAMKKYGATRTTVDSNGVQVPAPNTPAVVSGSMSHTATKYVFTFTNDRGTEVQSWGEIAMLDKKASSLTMKCYNNTLAIYQVRKNT